MLYISSETIVAFTADGIHSHSMAAGVATELPDHMIPSLVALGARPTDGKTALVEVNADRVAALVAAARTILAENTPESLTSKGTVKVALLEAAASPALLESLRQTCQQLAVDISRTFGIVPRLQKTAIPDVLLVLEHKITRALYGDLDLSRIWHTVEVYQGGKV